jgi:ABC-type dipeptide/oligopeptide/nickel transport system permease component
MKLRFVLRRVAILPLQVFGLISVLFVILQLLPGDPRYLILGSDATPQALHQLTRQLGLDLPIYERYFHFLGRLLHGDLGTSTFSHEAVLGEIVRRFPATFELVTFAFVIGIAVAVPMGVLSAVRSRGRILRGSTFTYGMAAGALPDFWWGLMLIGLFYVALHIVPPPIGRLGITDIPPHSITGLYTVDSLIEGNFSDFGSALAHLVLPGVTLAFVYSSAILKMTRTQMLEMMSSDFIRYAQACGLSQGRIYSYALRNAMLPVLTLSGLAYGSTLSGAVLIENIFSWGGLGQYAVEAVGNSDYYAVIGSVMAFATFALVVYMAMDVLCAMIDPRVSVA